MIQALQGQKKIQKKFNHIMKQTISAHKTEIKNARKQALTEAMEFVRKNSKYISRVLTREMHHIINQFLRYKGRTKDKIDIGEYHGAQLKEELAINALRFPVEEGEFGLRERNPLELYDCLIP